MNLKKLNEKIEKALDQNVKEWKMGGNQFKEIIVDTKEIEIIPGCPITYDKIENYKNGKLNRTIWAAVRNTDSTEINKKIQMEVAKKLGVEDSFKFVSTSGAVPLMITF